MTGLIHVLAAIQHVDEYLPYAVGFVLLAAAQFMWGVAVYRSPSRLLLSAGAVVSLAVAVLWIFSRTSGLPLGPERWAPEAVGAVDSIATANEVVLALVVYFHLRRELPGALARACARVTAGAALCLILLSALALLGGHAH